MAKISCVEIEVEEDGYQVKDDNKAWRIKIGTYKCATQAKPNRNTKAGLKKINGGIIKDE